MSSSIIRNRTRGQIMQGVLLMTVIAGVAGYLGVVTVQQTKLAKKRRQDIRFATQMSSGVETLLLAYRQAEIKYVQAVSNCDTANPFLRAMQEGAAAKKDTGDCAIGSVAVLGSSDLDSYGQEKAQFDTMFSYTVPTGACTITNTGSTCASGTREVLNVGVSGPNALEQQIGGFAYRFNLNVVNPDKQIVEFTVKITATSSASGATIGDELVRTFAIRPILTNAAHMEADGRVTQENPDPLGRCPNSVWANFLLFNSATAKCEQFAQLGGGTGLAYYRGRYFGFRPADGQIIDMLNASDTASTSYLVNEGGLIGSPNTCDPNATAQSGNACVFPPYKKDALLNTDDITVIEEQVYYVALSGDSAHIGVLDPTNLNTRVKVCDLGAMGWSQSYAGIAALSWSDPLLGSTTHTPPQPMAVFFLKTDAGDLFTAISIRKLNTTNQFDCFVFKDPSLQQVEYKRTYGFERTGDAKPYFIY